jgi:non-heme chloroperoxidase
VAFDARGHGDSDWASDGRYDQDIMVEDLKCVIAAFGNRRPALVGASLGGGTSLVAVGEDHVDATALVLVDVAPRIEPEGVAKILAFMGQHPEGFDSLQAVADAIANYQPHRRRPRNVDGLGKNVRLGADGKYRWHWDPKFNQPHQLDLGKRQLRLEACARNLKIPVLLVRGGMSDVLTDQGAREFLRLCPQCEYVNITDAAHMVAGDRNDIFGNAVITFLSRALLTDDTLAQTSRELHPHREGPPGKVQDIP